MYTIQAAYFTASEMGVLFFNKEDEGVGFIPSYALDFVRLETGITNEEMRKRTEQLRQEIEKGKDDFIRPKL